MPNRSHSQRMRWAYACRLKEVVELPAPIAERQIERFSYDAEGRVD